MMKTRNKFLQFIGVFLASGLAIQFQVYASDTFEASGVGLKIQFYEPKENTDLNQEAIRLFFEQGLKKLPPVVISALQGSKINIQFTRMDDLSEIPAPTCQTAEEEVRTSIAADIIYKSKKPEYQILLNKNLLQDIVRGAAGSRTYNCGHKSIYQLGLASLVHEIGHIYDFLNVPADPKGNDRSVSDRLDFLHLLGWDAGIFSTDNKNKLGIRSPDPYEYDSPAESFAVNFEFFTLDPEFACRRPAVFHYYSKHFGYDPYPGRTCKVSYDVPLSGKPVLFSIDPSRIYEIHYLLASKGTDMSSKWGHAMFRLVVCKPGREVGPDCIKDVGHHIVLSYRANVSDLVINSMKGLFGGYPSQLFLFLMTEIVEEYNVGESRDIYSVPIKMDREQITQFVHKTLEQTWQYQGRYFFIGNNCSTESMHFLQGIIPDEVLQKMAPVLQTPNGVYDSLSERGLLDEVATTVDNNVGRYFFPGFYSVLSPKFEDLKLLAGFPSDLEIEEYVSEYSAIERLGLFTGVLLRSKTNRTDLASRFLYLEMAVREHLRQVLLKESGKFVQGEIKDELGDQVFEKMIEETREIHSRVLPWNLLKSGYGVPLSSELISKDEFMKRVLAYNEMFSKIMDLVKKKVPGQYRDLDDVKRNTEVLRNFAIQN